MKKPCKFDRRDYLDQRDMFENLEIEDADHELCEMNNDAEDLAFELAYTRFRVADLEQFIINGVELGYIPIPEKGDRARKIIDDVMNANTASE